jgi:hypothetical protein
MELVRSGSNSLRKSGETLNVSSSGVLFTTDVAFSIGDPVEYTITLPTGMDASGTGVRLRCLGKIVRFAPEPAVAATVERYEFLR